MSNKQSTELKKPTSLSRFEEMEHWFNEFLPERFKHPFKDNWPDWPDLEAQFKGRFPRLDLLDRDDDVFIKVELPGVKKEDLDISIRGNVLTIKASTKHEEEEKNGDYQRREISQEEFLRSLTLPESVNSNKTKTSFKDGILELTLPKEEPAKRKTIKVD